MAKRHKLEAKKDSASAQELLAKQAGTYDKVELCKLLLEISLLDSAVAWREVTVDGSAWIVGSTRGLTISIFPGFIVTDLFGM